MMLCKLSLKNIKKSFKDYAIYFFTLILGVAIFYVFNALDSQTVMMNVSSQTKRIIEVMMTALSAVSVFVSFILGFLIIYASRFLIKRRNKEFGIYLTLGMSKRKISLILFFETLFIGIISLAVGLGIGVVLSQLMSLIVANMFEANLTKFAFTFSSSACIKTIIYFSVMYLIVMIFNTFSVSKCKLINLLNGGKVSEKVKLKNPYLCTIIFIISACVLGRAYYIVTGGFSSLQDLQDIIKPIIMGAVSTFFIFWSLSGLVLRITKKIKSLYYKGLNSFTLRQFSSKINTAVFTNTVICLMLFITICLLSACITLKNTMNENLRNLVPVDFQVSQSKDYHFNYDRYAKDNNIKNTIIKDKHLVENSFSIYNYDLKSILNDYTEVFVYENEDITIETTLGSYAKKIKEKYPFLNLEATEMVMTVSDYNKIAKLYGNEEYSLKDNEYMIIADYDEMIDIRDEALRNKIEINVFNHNLVSKYDECKKGFLEMTSSYVNLGIIIVPDNIVDDSFIERNYVMGNYKVTTEEEKREIEENLKNLKESKPDLKTIFPYITTRLELKDATVGLSAMVTFIGLYLGVIFLISSAAILGLKELSESTDNKERFNMLRKIGTDEKMINKALFRQIAITFMLPLVLALIHSIFGIMFEVNILEIFGKDQLLPSILTTAIFIVLIYGGYFLVTYYSSRRIIKEK